MSKPKISIGGRLRGYERDALRAEAALVVPQCGVMACQTDSGTLSDLLAADWVACSRYLESAIRDCGAIRFQLANLVVVRWLSRLSRALPEFRARLSAFDKIEHTEVESDGVHRHAWARLPVELSVGVPCGEFDEYRKGRWLLPSAKESGIDYPAVARRAAELFKKGV